MARFKVLGHKRFEGNLDGKDIKSAKLFVEVRLDDSRNGEKQNAQGYCTEELKVSPDILRRIEHLSLPLMVDIDTERVSNGRESKEVVIDVRPIAIEAAPVKVAKAA